METPEFHITRYIRDMKVLEEFAKEKKLAFDESETGLRFQSKDGGVIHLSFEENGSVEGIAFTQKKGIDEKRIVELRKRAGSLFRKSLADRAKRILMQVEFRSLSIRSERCGALCGLITELLKKNSPLLSTADFKTGFEGVMDRFKALLPA